MHQRRMHVIFDGVFNHVDAGINPNRGFPYLWLYQDPEDSPFIVGDPEHQPVQVKALALGLPEAAWQTITWREGSADWLSSRYARLRVRAAHRDDRLKERRAEEWLLIEWPDSETEPTKYWLATLPDHISFDRLVDLAQLRWRIERDYQELKQELGLAHYEGRGWRGFHHHATLCIAAYGFLISERETIPPQDHLSPRNSRRLPFPIMTDPEMPPDPARTAHSELDRHPAPMPRRRSRQEPRPMSLLQRAWQTQTHPSTLMTQ